MTWRQRAVAVLALVGVGVIAGATPASAHPLGNVSVNHYDGLTLSPDGIETFSVEDIAEIPTFQRQPLIDTDDDGILSDSERESYASSRCDDLASTVDLDVAGVSTSLTVTSAGYAETESATSAGLTVGRLECRLRASVDLSTPSIVRFQDDWHSAGLGWHEITAVGEGVSLTDSPVPSESISDALRDYPNNLLASPLDVRSVTLEVSPGSGKSTYQSAGDLPVAGFFVRQLDRLSTTFTGMIGAQNLTLGIGLLAVVLALMLGAGHALLPGHGKTIMAAYVVGSRGRLRDVVALGATVTITHTAGVLVLGLLLTRSTAFAPTVVQQALGVISGLIIVGVGIMLVVKGWRRRGSTQITDELAELERESNLAEVAAGGRADSSSAMAQASELARQHSHGHGHGHRHGHGHGHGHGHEDDRGFTRGGLVGLGIAGGLVPSPSALIVLLGAITLGRTVFGVLLVLAYGLGMAATLSAAALLLVKLKDRLGRIGAGRFRKFERLTAWAPVLTALLVVVVGLGVTIRAYAGTV